MFTTRCITHKSFVFVDARVTVFNNFNAIVAEILFALLLLTSAVEAQPPWCSGSCFDRSTNINSKPNIYICASSTLPSCITCPAGCDNAVGCVYYDIQNNDTCGEYYGTNPVITGISIVVRKGHYSSKWKICRPKKNFGAGCFAGTEYTLTSNGLNLNYTGNPENCSVWPIQDSCHNDTITFVDPVHQPSFYSGTSCAPNPDDWNLYGGDEFSFILCGADDGDLCCGVDFIITFERMVSGVPQSCTRTYTCIISTPTACNNPCY